jgi:hypothetical protein
MMRVMERLMFVWDELDDLVGRGRIMISIVANSMWSAVASRR